jgi:hypothetical protein
VVTINLILINGTQHNHVYNSNSQESQGVLCPIRSVSFHNQTPSPHLKEKAIMKNSARKTWQTTMMDSCAYVPNMTHFFNGHVEPSWWLQILFMHRNQWGLALRFFSILEIMSTIKFYNLKKLYRWDRKYGTKHNAQINWYSTGHLLGDSKTNVTVSALSPALIVMMSSLLAHFKILAMLHK